MSILETFVLALQNVFTSKMRTFLTMLGIIIGVAAVIVIVGLGNGMTGYMEQMFATLGTNSLTVMVTGRGSARSLDADEMYRIVSEHQEELALVTPNVSVGGTVKIGTEELKRTTVSGVGEHFFAIKDYQISQGRALGYMDMEGRKSVCVIGKYLSDTYFRGNALGQTVKVGGHELTVVGVMAQENDEMDEGTTDDCIYLPYSTAARYSTGYINQYTVTVRDESRTTQAKQAIEDGLYDIFRDSSAYAVISMSEMLSIMTDMIDIVITVLSIMTDMIDRVITVLSIIAGISLVVGGIGIMNIMLVSVTERTREIGIRKALGAKEGVIMRQFVMEAATTAALGGTIGIGLGYLASSIATTVIQSALEAPLQVTPSGGSIALAFGVSAGIGVLFGYLPAKKASRLNPIDALRYD